MQTIFLGLQSFYVKHCANDFPPPTHSGWILAAISKSFLSQVRERIVIGAMSKRRQNTKTNDGSPTAKARPVNRVMRSQYKEETST